MSYADALRAATPTLETAASLIEGLLVNYIYVNSSTLRSTTSTSLTDITSMSGSLTVAANEIVLLFGQVSYSHGTANEALALGIARGGTSQTTVYSRAYRSDTTGFDMVSVCSHIEAPGAGTYTYSLQWATGGGTVYAGAQKLFAICFQNT